jgi:hypothetical protein
MAIETFKVSASGKASIVKDPDAVLDYALDWTDWLGATDILIDAAWDITNGAAVESSLIHNNKVAVVWISGGDVGTQCALRCRITTVGGRIDDRTVFLKIKER